MTLLIVAIAVVVLLAVFDLVLLGLGMAIVGLALIAIIQVIGGKGAALIALVIASWFAWPHIKSLIR